MFSLSKRLVSNKIKRKNKTDRKLRENQIRVPPVWVYFMLLVVPRHSYMNVDEYNTSVSDMDTQK